MRDSAAPVTSEVVRRRLEELFGQLHTDGSPQTVGGDYGEGPPVSRADPVRGARSDSDEQDWLTRLRASPVSAEPSAPAARAERWSPLVGRAVSFTKAHLATVVIVLVVGISWTAYSLVQARATPVADAAPRVEATPSGAAPSGGASSTGVGAAKLVVVHVIGAVSTPGVVQLPDGSRIADAIAAAGGLAASAAVGELNLAQVLVDGTQLKIGNRKHPGGWVREGSGSAAAGSGGGSGAGASQSSAQPAKVALNTASLAQLDTLPGIGPVTAQKILDWRKAHGKFTAITELQEVDGIGPKTYADLADRVRL
jgi:competence protein ComEA